MAKKMKTHTAVSSAYADGVAGEIHARHQFPFPRAMVWSALLDAEAWTEWLPITQVDWTSQKPFGVGTTRTVEIGSDIVEETFFAWDDGQRMAFSFDRSTLPIKCAIEDYRIVDNAAGCELQWSFRMDANFPINPIFRWMFIRTLRKGMPKLEKLIASNPKRFVGG